MLISQASGEAKFMSDSPPSRGDLYCDVILSSVGNADIDVIDFTEAERIPGFVQIISSNVNIMLYFSTFLRNNVSSVYSDE